MKTEICNILESLHPELDYSQQSDFIENGMLDSFDIVNLVSELEEKFDIVIDGIEIIPENFNSLDAIESLILRSEKK